MTMRLTLRELEVFIAVADAGTVTRAADTLALTQSAASQALASLENDLGVTLFDRVGRRLLLNEHGRLLLSPARALLDGARGIEQLFDGAAVALRLGASTTVANYLLPAQLARFRAARPDARVELEVANTHDIVEAVAAFAVDVGFIEGPCHHPDLRVTPWRDDELAVFVGAGHPLAHRPVSLAELAEAQWILREAGSGTREEVERLLLPELGALPVALEIGHSEAIKHLVAAGMGVSCLSRVVIADLLAAGTLVEVDAPLPALHRPLYRVMHREKVVTRGLAAFLDETD
ncbi:LysR family transcriptional regulator [Crenobacter sp. SG2303]|uniref:LysR family transcriptional regulator n=1 Tax=Crenobacter oryzisoli TaxID=3056844 RepID=A0ABT7XLX1_9NEIS|nr:LysR family transcriptional regulator [Crenobacter sp. SG2303]MDN0074767.1 LysR family transcriptional regulator [Crenobacter sp. SG2303]